MKVKHDSLKLKALSSVVMAIGAAGLVSSCGDGEGADGVKTIAAKSGSNSVSSVVTTDRTAANDFNHDGNADVLFQNTLGQLYVWHMNGAGSIGSGGYFFGGGLGDWRMVGNADLNNDGNADVLLQNAAGQLYVWHMNGAGVIASGGYLYSGALAPWKVVGTADLNNDGNADVLFQNPEGLLYVWHLNGAGTISSGRYLYDGGLGDWKVASIADLNNDGYRDIVFQNSTGHLYVWFLNGAGAIASGGFLSSGLGDWKLVSTADMNNDDNADLMFQNDAGQLYVWYMNGAGSIVNGGYLYSGALGDWRAFAKPASLVQATIDDASVTSVLNDFGGVIPICRPGGASPLRLGRSPDMLKKILSRGQFLQARGLSGPMKRALALSETPPADQLGSCGGRYGYRNYSHVNGVTTATLAFENYCSTFDSDTGEQQTVNGSVDYVETGTPTAQGPVTTQIDASSIGDIVTINRNAAGATVNSGTVNFNAFKMAIGVPNGTPTAANPDVVSMGDFRGSNVVSGMNYRMSDFSLSMFENASGNTEMSFGSRGYNGDGTYYGLATTQPIVQDSNGETLSGQITASGANGSNAVATLVPGAALQATLTVNGQPVTTLPACK